MGSGADRVETHPTLQKQQLTLSPQKIQNTKNYEPQFEQIRGLHAGGLERGQ